MVFGLTPYTGSFIRYISTICEEDFEVSTFPFLSWEVGTSFALQHVEGICQWHYDDGGMIATSTEIPLMRIAEGPAISSLLPA